MSYTKKLFTFLIIALTIFSMAPAQMVGADDTFNSTNNIQFYDPNAVVCTTTSSGPLVGNDNAEKIYKYFVDKGLTGQQAAGILGNIQQEATINFDPAIIQGGAIAPDNYMPVNEVGFGLIQWTFTDRQQPLVDLAKSTNRNITDIHLQLDYIWQELNGKFQHSLEAIKAADNPVDAAVAAHGPPWPGYEASADSPSKVIEVRGGNATRLYEKYKSLTPEMVSGADNCNGGQASGDYISDFTFYNQCDSAWGTRPLANGTPACNVSCGPTSVAMAIKNMSGQNVTPTETIDYVFENNLWLAGNAGTSFDTVIQIAENWDINARMLENHKDINEYKEILDNGGLVMVAGSGAVPFVAAPQAHFVLIRAITPEGKFLVADPYPKTEDTNEKAWDTGPIIDGTFGAIAFTK